MAKQKTVTIGPCKIGEDHPVCVVTELGVNHLGDFTRAKEMIHAAHEAGADLLKFQTYQSEQRYDRHSNPKADEFIARLAKWEFPREKDALLWEYAKSLGATVFTSAFDPDSVQFADDMGTEAYKIAAFEITNLKLLRAVAEKKKPVVISRGMASFDEIDRAIELLDAYHTPYILLHCISSYPVQKKDSHLRMIHTLKNRYNCPIGHSDHTIGTDIPPLAVAAGASMIEKHFTITPKYRESDNFFSITPEDLQEMIFKIRQVETFMGKGDITVIPVEEYMHDFRRETR